MFPKHQVCIFVKMYLNSINTYRGIAILFIVSAHCYSISGIQLDNTLERVFANLMAGSTIHFIFISGFLFHHIFYRKQKTNSFFYAKVKRLLVPYSILSIGPILIKLQTKPEFWNAYLPLTGGGIVHDYIIPSFLYYITGAHLVAYWYIPFALCLFLMYPLHVKFIELKLSNQLIIVGVCYIIAILIHRPVNNLAILQSVFYFTPAYLLGILCSMNKTSIYAKLKGKEFIFFWAALVLAIVQALLGRYNNYQKLPFIYDGIDLVLLQKSVLCIFFMVFLYRYEGSRNRFIVLLASTSFGIYFIHSYVLYILTLLKTEFEVKINYNWPAYFLIWGTIVICSMLLALLMKKLFPKYAVYITGY